MHFFTNWHVQKIQKCWFLEKKPPEAQRDTELPWKKQHMPPMKLSFFTEISKSHFFLKKLDFDANYQVEIKQIMKPKMVPMVHTNILYSVDWGICDSKSQFETKSQNRHFQVGSWKSEIGGFGTQNDAFEVVPETRNTLKYILHLSVTIPAQFPCIKHTQKKEGKSSKTIANW